MTRRGGAGLPWVPFRAAPPPLRDAPSSRTKQRGGDQLWREIRIGVRRYHRLLRAVLIVIGVAIVVARLSPKPAPTTAIVAAARDLPAGAVLTAADLRTIALPPATVPAGATTDLAAVLGSQLSGPLRRGEPLTDVRLTDGVLSRPAPGVVSAPVRLADSQAAQLLQPGQRIDVLAASTAVGDAGPADTGSGSLVAGATVVAADVMVIAIPIASASPGGSQVDAGVGVDGALVLLATSPLQARLLAQAQVTSRLSAVVVG
ncbi:MAG TPA: SAF domain-containing protein [Acidothermaceae bacterium]